MVKGTHVKWLLSLLIPAATYFLVNSAVQADPTLNPHLPAFFTITLWAITVWATDILPAVPTAAAMTFLYLLLGVAKPPVIFGAWSSFLPWICFGALILSQGLKETGLTKRLALTLMRIVGATLLRVIVSLMTVGIFMAFLLPDIMCRVIVFCAIAHGLVLALELDPESRISSAIIMAGFCAATSPGYGFLTGTEMALIAIDQIKTVIAVPSWAEYAIANLPFILLYCAFSVFMCYKIIPGKEHVPHEDHLNEVVEQHLREMGPMTMQEWKMLGLLVVAITGLLTQKWHGFNGYFVYALVATCAYLPVLNLAKVENVRKLNVGFLVFVVGCLSMGAVAVNLGAAKWFAALVAPMIQDLSPAWLCFSSYLSAVAVNFMLTPLAAVSSLSLPWMEIAQSLGQNPLPMLYSFLYGLDQYIFPYEYALYMYIFGTGCITPKHIFAGLGMRIVFVGAGLLLIQVPYWKLLCLF
ncbi:SLC13 family permease [uncultured Desulfovibrio sp.]|uniref:SLC13 family permease n=1 Tax=uncultured Desulfovibrio sp. TaxID=167968 RepID=UPI0003A2A24C|nr:SLC13 family permease [uncultured Desulfovibrio sp.]